MLLTNILWTLLLTFHLLLDPLKIIFMIFSLQSIQILFFATLLIKNIMSLNHLKAIGPNSIPTKILKLVINDVSSRLTELFNLSFTCGVFPLILKTSKVIPVYKKDSKLKCSNYRPVSSLSNIDKVLEKLM